MDFLRFFRRKNPYAEFDELLGLYSDHLRPGPWWRGYHAMRVAARKFFDSFRRKRPIDINEPLPPGVCVVSPRVLIQAMRAAGIKSAEERWAERKLLWWNLKFIRGNSPSTNNWHSRATS